MKLFTAISSVICIGLAIGLANAQTIVSPPNFTVTTPAGSGIPATYKFDVNGQDSGDSGGFAIHDSVDFSLNAGATYIFQMNTAAPHPVDIATNANTFSDYVGASAQAVNVGTVTVTIPATNFPPFLYYVCNVHSFYGMITVNPPQPPPDATILNTAVSTNILITFAGGTNTITLAPQFSSNLLSGTWQNVPGYTNTFSGNGTNTTSFDRLDAICGPNVFLRISQAPN